MRLTLTYDEITTIRILLNENKEHELNEKIFQQTMKPISEKKLNATQKATNTRIKNAKKKIENAQNLLRMSNKKITYYSISKESGVSYNTVKKYITLS